MIKIVAETEEELNVIRRKLGEVACARSFCPRSPLTNTDCDECIDEYLKDKVCLYKREVVEEPAPLVV